MNSFEHKKLAILRILQILYKYSDVNHPLTQEDIARYLFNDYGVTLERKAIGKNVTLLREEAGFDIISEKRGSYLDGREFEDSELKLLIDSILYSRYINPKYAKDLIEKLSALGSRDFAKNLKTSYIIDHFHDRTFSELFNTIDMLEEKKKKNVQVKFFICEYGVDKKLHHVWDEKVVVNPYRLISRQGNYYLVCSYADEECLVNLRIEYISDIELTDIPRRPIEEMEKGDVAIDNYLNAHPQMYNGSIVTVKMRVARYIFTDLIENFGKDFTVEEIKDEAPAQSHVNVTLRANSWDIHRFALEYLGYVTVLSPEWIIKKIEDRVSEGYNAYILSSKKAQPEQ